jgi:hypothetical protein
VTIEHKLVGGRRVQRGEGELGCDLVVFLELGSCVGSGLALTEEPES